MEQNKAPVDTLHVYGNAFQSKVLSLLLKDNAFLEQAYDIITPAFFESEANQWITKHILKYFNEYKKTPTLEVFKIELNEEKNDDYKTSIVSQLRDITVHAADTDLEYIKDKFLDFCKNQALKNAIIQSVDLIQAGDYSQVKTVVDKALHAGTERNIGHDWKKDVEKRHTEIVRNTIPTPWQPVNNILRGGLGGGELGIIAAPPGIGKSWLLGAIGANAVKNKNVFHYTLELNEEYVGLRYDTIRTGIETERLKDNREHVERVIAESMGQLIIKFYPTKSITSTSITAHINQMALFGLRPDLVIIDYADLLRSSERVEAHYRELGAIYEELRGIAGELDIPVWTASQTQRSSTQQEIIEADKIAESFNKIMIADFIMSLSRKSSDKMNKTARIHIIKNRFGPDGVTFPTYMDTATGTIEIYDSNSERGQSLNEEMDQIEKQTKAKLLNKFREME